MYHSVVFGTKNTWEDWHLIPSSRPTISMAPVTSEKFIDIPGKDGQLDISDYALGHPTYGNRTGSIEFIVVNDWWDWIEAYHTIASYLHGKRMKLILEDDDPFFYFEGRFKVNQWNSDKDWSKITIDYTLDPFKKSSILTDRSYEVTDSMTVSLHCGDEYISPNFKLTDGSLTLTYTDSSGTSVTKSLASGDNVIEDYYLSPGMNTVIFAGTGTVQPIYREGYL